MGLDARETNAGRGKGVEGQDRMCLQSWVENGGSDSDWVLDLDKACGR